MIKRFFVGVGRVMTRDIISEVSFWFLLESCLAMAICFSFAALLLWKPPPLDISPKAWEIGCVFMSLVCMIYLMIRFDHRRIHC